MAGMSGTDLGRRIAAARAYTGMSVQSLADAVNVTVPALERFENDLADLSEDDRWALLCAIANATRLPTQFFTVDFATLPDEGPPSLRLAALEGKVESGLEEARRIGQEAQATMDQGKDQLQQFLAAMEPDRDLIRQIAAHLGIPT